MRVPDRPLNEATRPVGPPMKVREAVEFLVTVAGLDVGKLAVKGQPDHVADIRHVEGLCYELCRFTQAARKSYEREVKAASRNPGFLAQQLEPTRALVNAVADRVDFRVPLEKFQISVFAGRLQRSGNTLLPFVFWGEKFADGLLVTAVFYLGLSREANLVRRCRECHNLFLAVRCTRFFCSRKCASKAAVDAFRERQSARAARDADHSPQV